MRRALATATLTILSVLVALALGEGMIRTFRPQFVMGADPIDNPFWRYDPELGWSHAPGVTGTFSRDEFTHQVRNNTAGWRDLERETRKRAGAFRIVVLGDSFTWGHGVEDGQIFTRLLESELGVETLNLGLSASSTDQQLLILRKHGFAYEPDIVLVMFTRNDFESNVMDRAGSYPKPRFVLLSDQTLRLTGVPVPEVSRAARLHYRLRRRLGLLHFVESRWEAGRTESAQDEAPDRDEAFRVTAAILEVMRDDARRNGATLVVAFVPSTAHTYLDPVPTLEARRLSFLAELAQRGGFAFLDLVPAFREAARKTENGRRPELHYPRDKHWNAAGHALAARELSKQLRQRGLIPVEPDRLRL